MSSTLDLPQHVAEAEAEAQARKQIVRGIALEIYPQVVSQAFLVNERATNKKALNYNLLTKVSVEAAKAFYDDHNKYL